MILLFNASDFINSNISQVEKQYIIGAAHQACELSYSIVNDLSLSKKILQKREINNLKNLIFEALLKDLSDTGAIGFKYLDKTNKNKSYEYGLLYNDNLKFTVSRVLTRFNIPKTAKFREALANESLKINLFPELEKNYQGKRYGILTYCSEYDKLKFMSFGIPERNCKKWLQDPVSFYSREDWAVIKKAENTELEKKMPNIKKSKITKFIIDRI